MKLIVKIIFFFVLFVGIFPIGRAQEKLPASFSATQNCIVSYGSATHDVQADVKLGTENNKIDYFSSQLYQPKHIVSMGVNPNPNYDGFIELKIDNPTGGISIVVNASNAKSSSANLAAWIDFNGNGIFDEGEMSEKIIVANSTSANYILKWTNLPIITKAKLSTYMRIRISSENFNSSLSQGHLADGEVEDYALDFDLLEVNKRVTVPNPNWSAQLGDTLTYTIDVKSKLNTTINLFDPIPSYTSYVVNSANLAGAKGSATLEGKTVDAIVWMNQVLTKGVDYSYTFKVVVDQLSTLPTDTIYNIAFAVMNGDTIASNNQTCNTLPIPLSSIKANIDTINLFKGEGGMFSYDILANDSLGACTKHSLEGYGLIAGTGPLNGSVSINSASKELEYTPGVNFSGIDSVWYYIKCSSDSSATKVYYLIHNPLSKFYYACPQAQVYLGFETLEGVTYYWYTQEHGGISLGVPSDNILVEKNGASDKGTWWVEPVYKGVKFPRIRIDLLNAAACGDETPQAGCMVDGTVIFKEDFDSYDNGNDPSSSLHSTISIGSRTNYKFFNGIYHPLQPGSTVVVPHDGEYSIQKNRGTHGWAFTDDHTSSSNPEIGRAMLINANATPGLFYTHTISDLCNEMKLSFSVWLASVCGPTQPDLKFILTNPVNNMVLAVYYTSKLTAPPSYNRTDWKQYGFHFDLPLGVNSIRLDVVNYSENSSGNDFAMDDIEIRFCAPPVIFKPEVQDTILCLNSEFMMEGMYTDDGTFGNALNYRWEYKVQKTDAWTVWKEGNIVSPLAIDTTIASISKLDEGYYRLAVSNSSNINSPNCRAISDSIFLKVRDNIQITDIRVKACSQPGTNLDLSKYLYEKDYDNKWTLQWTRVSNFSPVLLDPVKGTIDMGLENKKHTYQYYMKNECSSGTARFYLSGINEPAEPIKQVVFCKDFAQRIHLDQIFGLESGAIEVASNVQPHLVLPVSPFLEATILNGKAVWDDPAITLVSYKGEPAKIVKVTYKTTSAGCWPSGTEFELEVIIVEDNFVR